MFKKIIASIIIGTIFYFLFGWFVFDFLLGNYTNLHTTQLIGFKKDNEHFSILLLVISCMAYAILISFIFIYLLNLKNLLRGFLIGTTIGVLVSVMTDTYWYATSNFYSNVTVVFLDILAAGVTVGSTGFLITYLNKRIL